MKARETGAGLLVVLALAVGASACGGSHTEAKSAGARAKAEAHWRSGLLEWRHHMLRALDGISILLETQVSVGQLEEANSPQTAALERFELTLAGCSSEVDRLGSEPLSDDGTRAFALAACSSLERGGRLISEALNAFEHGSLQALDIVSEPLSSGQSEMEAATSSLAAVTVPSGGRG